MKLPIVNQHDEKDCGAACLSMVARYYGLRLSIVRCRELIRVDNDGANMYGLIQGANEIGFSSDALEGSFDELIEELRSQNLTFPFVARIISEDMFEHYVVVYKITDKKVIIGDPAKGKAVFPVEMFKEIWTGHIVTFKTTGRFEKGNTTKDSMSKFIKLITSQKKLISLVVVISLFISLVSLIGSMVFEYIVNNVLYSGNSNSGTTQILSLLFSNINTLCISIIVLYLFQGAVQVLRSYLLSIMSKRIDIPLTMNFYRHLIHLPIRFFGRERVAKYSPVSQILPIYVKLSPARF